MVRFRVALVEKHARAEAFQFTYPRAVALAERYPAIATDYLLRALNSDPRNPDALRLGTTLASRVSQPELLSKCQSALLRQRVVLPPLPEVAPEAGEGNIERYVVPIPESSASLTEEVHRISCGALEVRRPPGSGYGRGLYATEPISAGRRLAEESALLVCPLNGITCPQCLQSMPKHPAQCGGCEERYCSDGCRTAAMQSYHAPICGAQAEEFERWKRSLEDACQSSATPASDARSAFQLLTVGKICAMATIAQEHPRRLPGLSDLAGAIDYQSSAAFLTLGAATMALSAALRQPHLYLEDLIALLAVVQSNEWCTPAGSLLFRCFSMINHSCVPNVTLAPDTTKTPRSRSLVAVQGIRKGEQLFLDYTSVLGAQLTFVERQPYLQLRGITCACSKCVRRL